LTSTPLRRALPASCAKLRRWRAQPLRILRVPIVEGMGSRTLLQALLLLLSISSCCTHWFWPPRDDDTVQAAEEVQQRIPVRVRERIHLDGEELRRGGGYSSKHPVGVNAHRRRLSTLHDITLTESHSKREGGNGLVGRVANGSAVGNGTRDKRGRGRRREVVPREVVPEGGGAGNGARVGDRIVGLPQRRQGLTSRVVVRGGGLEEAVMGEPATVIVEVQGWANGKGCSRGVKIRLLRQNGHVESNGTNALCRTFKDQPPPSPPPHHLNPPSDSAAPKQPMRPDNSSISPPPPPPSSDPSEPAKPPASPPIDDSSEGAQRRRGRRPKTWARRLRQDEASELPIIAHQGAVQTAEDQDLVVSAGVAGNSSRSCSIPDATGACEVYQLDYVAMHWGSFVLVVLVDGEQAPESPFRPFVFPPPTYPWFNSSSLQAATDDWQYGDQLRFSVVAKNFLSHRVPSCAAQVSGWLTRLPNAAGDGDVMGRAQATRIAAQVTCDNTTGSSVYMLGIEEIVSDGKWQMSALMDQHPILHSPLVLTIRPGVSAKRSNISGDGTVEAHVGQPAEVVLRLRMHNHLPAVDCREPAVLVLALQQEGAGTAQAPKKMQAASSIEEVSSGNVSMIEDDDVVEDDDMAEHDLQPTEQQQDGQPEAARTVFTGELVSCAAGEYHFTYMVAQAGSYRLSVLVGRDKELVGHMPLIIQALPGALSSQHCGLVGKRVGTGTLLYGSSATLSLYLRDAFGNYISCAHYRRGLQRHNITGVSIYHEPGDDAPAAWSALGSLTRCHDSIYHESSAEKIDGVVDVRWTVPHRNLSGESTKELSLDLEVSVNGRRLKEGPYTTLMRPARLDPAKSVLLGQGVRGASPGEEEVLLLQLVNELSENMTTCSTSGEQVVGTTVEIGCSALRADACQTRSDCEWLPVDAAVGAGVCNTVRQRELVEIFLEPIVSVEEDSGVVSTSEPSLDTLPQLVPAASGAGVSGSVPESAEVTSGEQEKRAGTVKSCDHGTYTLSYTMADAGRYRLFVKVAGQNSGGGPWRVTIAPGCRSGAVVFPCLGRGMCLRSGRCKCSDGYLGSQCHIACPGLSDDGTYCSGRGNCSAVSLTSSSSPKVQEEAAREASVSLGGGGGADMDVELGMCTCQYGYFGRLCDRECPGGASSACSDCGRCLDNGDCECWPGYGGDKCQFKNKEVQKFGSMAALSIVLGMLMITMVLVMAILLKQKKSRSDRGPSYHGLPLPLSRTHISPRTPFAKSPSLEL